VNNKDHNKVPSQPKRNDPCPCGSGKKYKKCCMLKDRPVPGPQDVVRSRLIESMFEFIALFHKDIIPEAYDFFWEGQPPEETLPKAYAEFTEINFHEWLMFDYVVDHHGYKTFVDLYQKQKKNLSDVEKEILDVFKDSVLSLYEVQEVVSEQGLIVKDLLLGGEYVVKERMGTRGLFRWDIFAARLLHIDDRYIICGSIYPYPVKEKPQIINAVMNEYRDFKEENPTATLRDCLKIVGSLFNDIWYDIVRSDRLPGIRTKTGEPFMLCKTTFTFSNRKEVVRRLKASKELEDDNDGGFIWLEEPGKDGSTIFGMISIKGKSLILECMSKKRMKMGKELIQKILGDMVSHRSNSVKDPYEVLGSKPVGKKAKPVPRLPKDIEQQLYDKFMHEHMTKWLDEQIPALDNGTPRECVKTKTGKERVIDLLKSFENTEERKRKNGEPYFDLKWVWQALHLKRPE